MSDAFSLYILRCSDDTLYTGIALDVDRRLAEHAEGRRGAKYLRGRHPFTLVFKQAVGDRSVASRLEREVKRWPRAEKLALIGGQRRLPTEGLEAGARNR